MTKTEKFLKFGAMGDNQARLKFKDTGHADINEEFHFQLFDTGPIQ